MGRLFAWFQKDSVAELEKDKAKLIDKKEQIEAEIDAIELKIEELKSENKG